MYFIRAIRQANCTTVDPKMGQRGILANPQSAVGLYSPIYYIAGHLWAYDLDHSDQVFGCFDPKAINFISGSQRQQTSLFNFTSGFCDILTDAAKIFEFSSKSFSLSARAFSKALTSSSRRLALLAS